MSADAPGLRIGDHAIAWGNVRRLEACERDACVGDCLCLAILGAGDRVIEIGEASPGWDDAGNPIERFLPRSVPPAQWKVRLIAGEPRRCVAVYPVG